MALATVTGYLKDVGLVSLGNRSPELVFEIDDLVTAGSGTLIPQEPITVVPGSDGSFSVSLHPSEETNPYAPYRLTVNWQSKGINRSITPEWRIFVPAGGGTIADMIAVVTPTKIITKGDKGDAGNALQQAAIDSLTAKNVTQDGRLDSVESKNTSQDGAITAARTNAVADAKTYTDTKAAGLGTRIDNVEVKNTEQDGRLNGIILASGASLNTLKTSNTYIAGTPTDWAAQGYPINAGGKLRSDFWSANNGIHEFTTYGTTQYKYTRIFNSSGVGPWSLEQNNATLIYGNGYVQPPVEYAPEAATKGLWKFDTVLTDSSGNGNTLTQVDTYAGFYATDFKYGTRSLGGGVYQNAAVDTFLSSTGTTGGTFTTGTVEGWIRTIPHTGIKVAISHRNWFWIGMAVNGTPIAKYGQGGNEKTITGTTVLSGPTYASSPWHHVALVFDGSNGVRLYVDGKLEGSNAAVETVGSSTGFTVGGLQGSPTFNWDVTTGRIDEVRISNTARYAAVTTYPIRPTGLKPGGALFIGPVLPPERQPFDRWLKTETM